MRDISPLDAASPSPVLNAVVPSIFDLTTRTPVIMRNFEAKEVKMSIIAGIMNDGIKDTFINAPIEIKNIAENTSLSGIVTTLATAALLDSATDWRTARALIAMISSIINTPRIIVEERSLIISNSSKILIVTTVLVIDIAKAKNIESKNENPSVWDIKNTISNVPIDSGNATIIETLLTDLSLAIGNSVPITKSSIIMPNSERTFTV